MTEFDLETYLRDFAKIVQAQELINDEWVCDGYWCKNRWLHAAIWGALVKAVPGGLIPLVEPSMDCNYKPDLVMIDNHLKKHVVVEYESSNSSDERLVLKDLAHYKADILSYRDAAAHGNDPEWHLPKVWLIISTLPSCAVTDWPWHGYNRNTNAGPAKKSQDDRNRSPLAYYEEVLHTAFAEHWREIAEAMPRDKTKKVLLVWANIDQATITIKNLNGFRQESKGIPLLPQSPHEK